MSNPIHRAFDTVKAEDALKDSTKEYIASRVLAGEKRKRSSLVYLALALCFCFIIFSIGGYSLYTTPVSAVSIDINPSIELGVNRFDRIVDIRAFNDDGEEVIAALDLKNMKYDEAVEAILTSEALSAYISDTSIVSICVAADDDDKEREMLGHLSKCTENSHCEISHYRGNTEDIEEAHSCGMSMGKYNAYLELAEIYPDITLEEVKDLTMSEIKSLLQGKSQSYNGAGGKESTGNQDKNWQDTTKGHSGKHGKESNHSGDQGNRD